MPRRKNQTIGRRRTITRGNLRRKVSCLTDAKHPKLELTSPRSVEACLHLGIEPSDLIFRNLDYYQKQEHDPELAALAFEFHESTRQVNTITVPRIQAHHSIAYGDLLHISLQRLSHLHFCAICCSTVYLTDPTM